MRAAALLAVLAAASACRKDPGASPPVRDDGGPGPSAASKPAPPLPDGPRDAGDEPLPPGAIARLGSLRFLDPGLERLAFAAGGRAIVSSNPRGLAVWDAATGARLGAIGERGVGPAIAVAPDGAQLLAPIAGGKVGFFDLASRAGAGEIAVGKDVDEVCFAGPTTAVAAADGLIVAWRLPDRGELRRVEVPPTDLSALGCAASVAAWGDDAGKVAALALGDPAAAPVELGAIAARVTALAVSPDGRRIAAGAADGNVAVFTRGAPGKPLVIQAHDRTVASVAFVGDELWTSGGDAWLRRWATDGALLQEVEGIKGLTVQLLAIAPDGAQAATWSRHRGAKGSEAGRFWRWNLATGDLAPEPERHGGALTAIAFAPDGEHVATAAEDRTVRVWDATTGAAAGVLTAQEGAVNALAFAADGATIYSAGADAYLDAWSWEKDLDAKLLGPIGGEVNAFALTADGARAVTGDEVGRVWSWDLEAKAKIQAHDRRVYASITGVATSPDGRLLAITGSERTILIVDLASGAEKARLQPEVVSSFAVAFAPDGKLLATAGDDGRIRLWDVATWKEARVLEGHDGTVRALAFSRDGAVLASGGSDETARIWTVADGSERARFEGHGGAVTGVALAPDAGRIATASQDHTGLVWSVPAGPTTPAPPPVPAP